MAITPNDKKISDLQEVAATLGMFLPAVDLSQPDPDNRNVRFTVQSLLSLANLSSYVPTSRVVGTAGGSLTGGGDLSADRALSLVNDNAAPGASTYYGTNGAGTKGFFALPAAGTGTVTNFSAGNLPPVFTTNVSNPTTTPSLSFSLTNQNASTVFAGPAGGGPSAPAFRTLVATDIPSLSSIYQPLNANLTSISALTTTVYGLGFLELVDASAARTYIGAGTGSGTVGPGTTNSLAKFTAASVVGDSIFSDNGSTGLIQSSVTGGSSVFAIQNTASAGLSVVEFRNNSGSVRSTFGFGNPLAGAPLAGNQFLYTASGVDFIFYTNATDSGRITSTRNFLWGTSTDTGGAGNMSVGGSLTLGVPLSTGNGGTGLTGYAEGDLLYGNGGGTLSKLAMQTLPGYFLVSGATPSWAQLSTNVVTSIVGTANEIAASASVGTVTLSLPAALTFTGKTVTGGTFTGGAFNGTIGATTPSTGAFTDLSARDILKAGGSASSGLIIGSRTTPFPDSWLIASPNGELVFFDIIAGQFRVTIDTAGSLKVNQGINDTPIGNITPSTGVFTTAEATQGLISSGSTVYSGASLYLNGGASTNCGIYTTSDSPSLLFDHRGLANNGTWFFRNGTGGSNTCMVVTTTGINATAIGATTPSTGAFTTVSTISGSVTGVYSADGTNGLVDYNTGNVSHFHRFRVNSATVASITSTGINDTVIGATTPAAGAFTSVASTNGTITSVLSFASVGLAGTTSAHDFAIIRGGSVVATFTASGMELNGKAVTEGAADSGGTGFRILRVPN